MDKLKGLLVLLDGKKTYLAGALVSAATYFFPPAQDLFRQYPDIAPTVVTLLLVGLRAVSNKPGLLARKPAEVLVEFKKDL